MTPGKAQGPEAGDDRPYHDPAFDEWEELEDAMLEPASAAPAHLDRDYFSSYADPGVHRLMIGDHARTDAYRRGLEALVKPGMRVLDVGTGTGILAMIAARAGAQVTAVDESGILELAQRLVDSNGLSDRIQLVRGRIEDLSFSQPFDLIVSEWMGFFALAECMFRSVVVARDRHLAPGGIMVPGRLEMFLAPLEDSRLHADYGIGLWERPVYGFDFREMGEHELHCLITAAVDFREAALLAPGARLMHIDLAEASVEDFFFDASVDFHIERDGRLHGFGGWFAVDLAPDVRLATGPRDPGTHWRQSYFPVRPFFVREGDLLVVAMKAMEKEYGDRRLPLYLLDARLMRDGEEVHQCFYRLEGSFE